VEKLKLTPLNKSVNVELYGIASRRCFSNEYILWLRDCKELVSIVAADTKRSEMLSGKSIEYSKPKQQKQAG
jgi:hypothetical protein